MSVSQGLSEQLCYALFCQGSVRMTDFMPVDYMTILGKRLNLLFDEIGKVQGGGSEIVGNEHVLTFAELRQVLAKRDDPTLQQVLGMATAIDNVAQVFFPRGHKIIWSASVCRRQTIDERSYHLPFHQDAREVGYHGKGLTMWFPLDDCGLHAPGLELFKTPCGVLFPVEENGIGVDPRVIESLQKQAQFWHPTLSPGDIMIYTDDTLHRTYVREGMNKASLSIEFRVIDKSSQPWFKRKAAPLWNEHVDANQERPYPFSLFFDAMEAHKEKEAAAAAA